MRFYVRKFKFLGRQGCDELLATSPLAPQNFEIKSVLKWMGMLCINRAVFLLTCASLWAYTNKVNVLGVGMQWSEVATSDAFLH